VQILGSGFVAHGLLGMAYPAAVHDMIKPELGSVQLWLESGRWPFWLGLIAAMVGMALGAAWAFWI